jgi:hypothetical protein
MLKFIFIILESSTNISQIKQVTTQSSSTSPNLYKESEPIFLFKVIWEQWTFEDLTLNIHNFSKVFLFSNLVKN